MSEAFGNCVWHGKSAAFTRVWIDSERSGSFRTYFSSLRQFGARRIEQSLLPPTRKIACNHPFLRLPGRQSFNPRNPAFGFARWTAAHREIRAHIVCSCLDSSRSRSISSEEQILGNNKGQRQSVINASPPPLQTHSRHKREITTLRAKHVE